MSRILVLYRSKYGSTKKYADMLKEELACDVFEIGNFPFHQAEHYDFIIAAGGIYAGGISVMKDIRRNQRFLSDKNVVIFAVGASPFYPKTFEELKKQNLKDLSFSVTMFYGRGAYDESVMSFKDRTLCRMLKNRFRKANQRHWNHGWKLSWKRMVKAVTGQTELIWNPFLITSTSGLQLSLL